MSNVRAYIFESNNEGDEAQYVFRNAISTTEYLRKLSIDRGVSKFYTFPDGMVENTGNG